MLDLVISIIMLAAFALLGGAFWLWRRGIYLRQALLMVFLAIVMFTNVAIWLVPVKDGAALAEKAQDRAEVQ